MSRGISCLVHPLNLRYTSLAMPQPSDPDTKRRRVNLRRPDVMELVTAEVAKHYRSSIVERLRDRQGELVIGHTTLRLAQEFGFCYGVERAIDLAYASRKVFPENRIFLIGEIIHNPEVNRQLVDMGIVSLPWQQLSAEYDQLTEEDVVIVPAFGAPTSFMDKIDEKGCHIVDTTCGDVMKVWRRVRTYAKDGITSIIHGKAGHEETRATASRALGENGQGHYLIILTLEHTDDVCRYIAGEGNRDEFLTKFADAVSPGFDPDQHLHRIGVANQTTMLKSETEEIGRLFERTLLRRYGPTELNNHFLAFNTICDATQERQDAMFSLVDEPLDLMVVIGGYNSSNTTHLQEIAISRGIASVHIDAPERIGPGNCVEHKPLGGELTTMSPFLPQGPLRIGITSGASTPDRVVEGVIDRLLQLSEL